MHDGTPLAGVGDVTIRNNRIHDLGSDTRTHAFSLGGSGTPLADEFTAYDVKVVKNRIWNVRGIAPPAASRARACASRTIDCAGSTEG